MERRGSGFCERLFTPGETAYCMRQRRPHEHFAARFAAKASLVKALGRGLAFKRIEVLRGEGGQPEIKAADLGEGFRLAVSISHDGGYSIAQVIVEK
ncbi:MAG: holo-ACP synthase [Deltaproteobacteria bacterium]|nr:holo-ACP synthase [Deltaproteobacteria bacterium]